PRRRGQGRDDAADRQPAGRRRAAPVTDAAPGGAPPVVPARLAAAAPGWTLHADVIVVGSGIAGLTAALRLRERVDRVLLVTKTVLDSGSTRWAQGGIAAA